MIHVIINKVAENQTFGDELQKQLYCVLLPEGEIPPLSGLEERTARRGAHHYTDDIELTHTNRKC